MNLERIATTSSHTNPAKTLVSKNMEIYSVSIQNQVGVYSISAGKPVRDQPTSPAMAMEAPKSSRGTSFVKT